MKENNAPAVKLKKSNNKYNTYQFYGELANKNIDLVDALKYAVLFTYKWLRERLADANIPKELVMLEPSDYKKARNEDFKSFYINDVFTIAVETNIDDGLWALSIIENDLGALKESQIVAGRVIRSDIAYRIVDGKLECGFSTQVSDANDIKKAECLRFKLVKQLGTDPIFGFKQITNLYEPNNMVINDTYEAEELKKLIKSKENQLPFIIYTYDDNSIENVNNIKINLSPSFTNPSAALGQLLPEKEKEDITSRASAYANRNLGNARPYYLPKKLFGNLASTLGFVSLEPSQVIIVEPVKFGGKSHRYDYEDKEKYQSYIYNYTREKQLDFHDVLFVDEAKIIIERLNEKRELERFKLYGDTKEKLEQYKNQQARETRLSEYVPTADTSKQELEDTKVELNKAKDTISVLNKEIDRLTKEVKKKNDYIEYIHRKGQRPKYHKDIPEWASRFESLILDKKAIALLEDNSAESVDLNTICDALDFLGTVYSDYLFNNLSEDELNTVSSNIYNRPYEVTPSGIPVSAKGDCKVKYAFEGENRIEHILDQHLKIGVHSELLRIYFIIDKDRKKIVIGSLPNHLEY